MKNHKVPCGEMITVVSFSNYIEANITADYLRQQGIDCFLADENSTACAILPTAVETRVMVSTADLDRAKTALNSYEKESTIMKNIIFDLGNVLISWDPDVVYKKYFANDLTKIERFYAETDIIKLNAEMDRGLPFQEALTNLSHKFPHYHEPIHLWKSNWLEMIGGPIEGSVKILELLHARGYPIYALTNWAEETFFPYIRHNNKYKFLNLFQDIVVSGVEKIIKPDPQIYQLLLQRNGLNPEDCIYIDDSPTNLIPARNLGMHAIEFKSPIQLANELQLCGIPTNIGST